MTTSTQDTVTLGVEQARELAVAALRNLEFGEDEAMRIAEHLLDSQLRGDRTGLARILLLAQTTPTAEGSRPPSVVRETDTTALVDGGGRFGFVAAEDATALAVEKARKTGVGVAGVNDHSFTGSLSYYLRPVVEQGMVAIAVSTLFAAPENARVAPYGAGTALLGTNPVAIGVPAESGPIIWDISTASISGGGLLYHLESGQELADGIALDGAGRPTRDPAAAWAGSVRTWGGHRGSGLAVLVQFLGLLCDVELGSGDMAFLVIVLDPAAFGSAERFLARATALAEQLRAARPEEGFDRVRLPYDGSRDRLRASLDGGVVVSRDVYQRLEALRQGIPVAPSAAGSRADGRSDDR